MIEADRTLLTRGRNHRWGRPAPPPRLPLAGVCAVVPDERKRREMARWRTMVLAVIVLLLPGCGEGAQDTRSDAAPSEIAPPESPPVGTTGPVASRPGRWATDSGGPGMQATPGEVRVALRQSSFTPGQMIEASVVNGLPEVIHVEDLKAGCSIAQLQRKADDGGWQTMPDCGSERLPALLAIGPGLSRGVSIDPDSYASSGDPLPPGVYRLAVQWRRADGTEGTSISGTFIVG